MRKSGELHVWGTLLVHVWYWGYEGHVYVRGESIGYRQNIYEMYEYIYCRFWEERTSLVEWSSPISDLRHSDTKILPHFSPSLADDTKVNFLSVDATCSVIPPCHLKYKEHVDLLDMHLEMFAQAKGQRIFMLEELLQMSLWKLFYFRLSAQSKLGLVRNDCLVQFDFSCSTL